MQERFETFTVLISEINNNIRKVKAKRMERYNLKSQHLTCLFYLYKENSLTVKQLCDKSRQDKAGLSRAIDYLENNGYVYCSDNAKKRYNSPLSLTEKGMQVAKDFVCNIEDVLDEAEAWTSAEDRVVMYRSLSLINENLQKNNSKIWRLKNMAIKIVVDSASDISKIEAEEMGIVMIPMNVTFGEEEYLDGETMLPLQFYQKMKTTKTLPKTSQVSEYAFEEAFKSLVEEGHEVIAITLSSGLSGTYNSAVNAAEKFDGKVSVVDSKSAALGERLLCEYALKLINEGKSRQEVCDELNRVKEKMTIMAMLNTLDYLRKGGRISGAKAFIGNMLSLKPVVAVVNGKIEMIGKAIGTKKGHALLNTIVEKKGGIDIDMPFGLLWAGTEEDKPIIEKFMEENSAMWAGAEDKAKAHILGCTIGSHVGPGTIGIAFFSK